MMFQPCVPDRSTQIPQNLQIKYNFNGRKLIPVVVPHNPYYKTQVANFIYEYVKRIAGEERASKITGMLIGLYLF
jgi:hypothetical protein